jgi:hypothetical protein
VTSGRKQANRMFGDGRATDSAQDETNEDSRDVCVAR